MEATYFVYIMMSVSGTLYIGVTNNLELRVWQHKYGTHDGFTSKYQVSKLVYFEETNEISTAIAREKQLKGWTRAKKLALVDKQNPMRDDLASGWYK
jgi:putative endonuclease